MTPTSFCFVTQYFPPERGAAQVRLASVTDHLVARGHRVEVVTSLPNYPTGRIFEGWSHRPLQTDRSGRLRVHRVWVRAAVGSGAARLANYVSFGVMSVVGLWRAGGCEWMVVEYPTLFGALPAVVWGRIRRTRVVINVADLWVDSILDLGPGRGPGVGPRLAPVLRHLEKWMLRRADLVTAVTEGVRDALVAKGVDPARLLWLPNGVDLRLFAPADETAPADNPVVLYAGTHGYAHGLDVLLDAARLLLDHPVRIHLVGGGSDRERLMRRAQELGCTNVSFFDPVAPETVAQLLARSVAGVATVRPGELYRTVRSAKVFPTMACARPVIYSGDGEGAELVAAAEAGIVTPAGDAPALAAAIRRICDHPADARRMGANGRSWVETNAGWEGLIDDWLAQLDAHRDDR